MKILYPFFILTFLLVACRPANPDQVATPVGVTAEVLPTMPPRATSTAVPTIPPTLTPTATSTPSPEPTPTLTPVAFGEPDFIFQGSDPSLPVVTRAPSAALQNLYINPGAMLFYDNQFHMFFNSFTSWPGVIKVGYMTSTDGTQWELVQETPVFTTDQIPYGGGKADVSSVQVLADETWVMFFHTIQEGQIGLATASSPLGPWQVAPEPILEAGPQGAWDDRGLFWPNVVHEGDTYYMYYGGKSNLSSAIGLALSPDGLQWTKYNDGATLDPPFQESDPVLVSSESWELNKVDRPRVQYTPDGWVMIFAGGAIEKRGLALSEDGVDWVSYPGNPILTAADFPIRRANTWDTALLFHEGAYFYFMEIGTLSGTDLYLTVHTGSLRP